MDSIQRAYDLFSDNPELSAGEVVHMVENQEPDLVIGVEREDGQIGLDEAEFDR